MIAALRGLAIILVVVGHVFKGFEDSRVILPTSLFAAAGYHFIYTFHMPFMFMISGFVHGVKDHSSDCHEFARCISKSITDLYLPGLCFSLILWFPKFFMFVSLSMENTEGFQLATWDSLYQIPFHGFSIYWFLCSLFFVKVMHVSLERFIRNGNIHAMIWAVLFIATKIPCSIVPSFMTQLGDGLYFHIGYLLRRHDIFTHDSRTRIGLGIILFLMGILSFAAIQHWGIRNLLTQTLCALSISIALFVIFYALDVRSPFLVLCGLYSMVIYIPHNSIIALLRIILRLFRLSYNGLTVAVLSVIFFAVSLFVPLSLVWLYKNVKCLRWAEYIFYPGKFFRRNPS